MVDSLAVALLVFPPGISIGNHARNNVSHLMQIYNRKVSMRSPVWYYRGIRVYFNAKYRRYRCPAPVPYDAVEDCGMETAVNIEWQIDDGPIKNKIAYDNEKHEREGNGGTVPVAVSRNHFYCFKAFYAAVMKLN